MAQFSFSHCEWKERLFKKGKHRVQRFLTSLFPSSILLNYICWYSFNVIVKEKQRPQFSMILDPFIVKLSPCKVRYPFWGIAHQSKAVVSVSSKLEWQERWGRYTIKITEEQNASQKNSARVLGGGQGRKIATAQKRSLVEWGETVRERTWRGDWRETKLKRAKRMGWDYRGKKIARKMGQNKQQPTYKE